jgi:hypothetical protein
MWGHFSGFDSSVCHKLSWQAHLSETLVLSAQGHDDGRGLIQTKSSRRLVVRFCPHVRVDLEDGWVEVSRLLRIFLGPPVNLDGCPS